MNVSPYSSIHTTSQAKLLSGHSSYGAKSFFPSKVNEWNKLEINWLVAG